MDWTTLPRLETTTKRLDDRSMPDGTLVQNIEYGINVYRNALSKDECKNIIDSLEHEISLNLPGITWSGAAVNDKEKVEHVRNCLDLKYKREHLGKYLPFNQTLFDIHEKVENALNKCMRDYESFWHLRMFYYESFNFVKYMPGKYFKVHADHGPYYTCTVSALVYLNDDYEGGELLFARHGLTFKPQAGDVVLFPSNYVYEHSSLEIRSGTKYCVVIMTDYNDTYHKG